MVRPWEIIPLEHAWLSGDVVECTEVGDPFVFTETSPELRTGLALTTAKH